MRKKESKNSNNLEPQTTTCPLFLNKKASVSETLN